MLIDKISRHLFRKSLGDKDAIHIIDPTMYLFDVYEDLSISTQIQDQIYELSEKIDNMDGVIGDDAPVSSINGKINDVYLDKSDLKRYDGDPNGLNRVDNTSDIDKMPSNAFKKEWQRVFSIISTSFDDMNHQTDAYKKHVTADGGTPTKQNPHRTLLINGIYHNGQKVIVDPNTFIRNTTVANEIDDHNILETAHPKIQEIIHPTAGTLTKSIDQLFNDHQTVQHDISTRSSESISSKIVSHNSNNTSHQRLSEAIEIEFNHLQEIYSTNENDRYEYMRYRLDSINLNDEYDREYPSVKAINDIIFDLPRGLSFYDDTITPHILLDPNGRTIDIKTSNGSEHTIHVNNYDINMDKMVVKVNREVNSFSEYTDRSNPAFVILSKPSIIGYLSETNSNWMQFKLNLVPKHNSNVISAAKYTPIAHTKDEYDELFPDTSLTGIYFSSEGAFIHHKKTFDSAESYRNWIVPPTNLIVTDDPKYFDPRSSIIRLIPQPIPDKNNPQSQSSPLAFQSVKIGGEYVQSNPQPFGVATCHPQQKSFTVNSQHNSFSLGNTRRCATIGTMQFDNLPFRDPNGSLAKMSVVTNIAGGWEQSSIDSDISQIPNQPFSISIESIIF